MNSLTECANYEATAEFINKPFYLKNKIPFLAGMLLEIDNSELVHMLEHQESLKGKVEEAVTVLQVHQSKDA